MKLTAVVALMGAVASALPTLDEIPTDAVSRSGRKFVIRRNKVPKVKRANQIIPVVVGGPQDTYVPNVVTAAVGDVIQFQFSNGAHTVTQSPADQGCTPLQVTDPTAIHSGHIPFQDGQTTVGTFNMVVTKTDPMFLYCATGPHCQEGQVMVINPVNAQQVVDYAKLSQGTTSSVDGTNVVGGSVGTIPLEAAAFLPAPAGAGGPPGGGAPATPAEAPPATPTEAPPGEAPPATPTEPAGAAPPAPAEAPPAAPAPAEVAPAVPAGAPPATPAEAPPATPTAPGDASAPAPGHEHGAHRQRRRAQSPA